MTDGATLLGHAMDEAVVLARTGGRFHAIGASCSHYGGPLTEGAIEGDAVRCPWHHACFDLRSGEAIAGPALGPVACFELAQRGDRLFVIGKKAPAPAPAVGAAGREES